MQTPTLLNPFPMPLAFEKKILSRSQLIALRANYTEPVVFTNGVFDILHRGHVSYLARARALGGCLVVGVNSDASARQLGKGPDRPINSEDDRLALIAALESVDAVVCFDELTPLALISALRPNIIVKGGDYDMETLPETALVRTWQGQALSIAFEHARSTTALVQKVRGNK